jgi:AcrR family transcriptional regulator
MEPGMSASKQATAVRRTAIARAALELVAADGLKGLRMAAVAGKVGIVPSGIYRHYRNKSDVLDAILAFIQGRLAANVRAVAHGRGDALARLHGLLMRHARLIRENEAIPLVVFSPDVYAGSQTRRRELLGIINGFLAQVASLVRQGQAEGVIRSDLAPEEVAVLFLGLVQPSTILWHLSAGRHDVVRQAESAWPMFCRAVRRDTAEKQEGH